MRRQRNIKRKGTYISNQQSCWGFSTHVYQILHKYTPFNFSVMAILHYQLNLSKAQWTTGENWIFIFKLLKLTKHGLNFWILIFVLKFEGFFLKLSKMSERAATGFFLQLSGCSIKTKNTVLLKLKHILLFYGNCFLYDGKPAKCIMHVLHFNIFAVFLPIVKIIFTVF